MTVKPETVVSPKDRWTLHTVIHGAPDWSLATGEWEGKRTLGCRWNGDDEHPLGRPVSRAKPIWFILPHELWQPCLTLIAPEGATEAMQWLNGGGSSVGGQGNSPRRRPAKNHHSMTEMPSGKSTAGFRLNRGAGA
jgi:hypothetical protein